MRLASLVAVTALAVAAAGCGGVENEPNLARAVERTEKVDSFRMYSDLRVDGESLYDCDTAVDHGRGRSHTACRAPDGERYYETIFVEGKSYSRPWLDESEDRWVTISGSETDDYWRDEEYSLEGHLKVLRAATRQTERIGEEEVRGAPTVHYRLTVDCEEAEIGTCPDGRGPADVWIDDDGLVRRIRVEHAGIESLAEFYGFGAELGIEAPPAAEVTEDVSWPDPEPCARDEAAPVSVDTAIAALQRHGFDVTEDTSSGFGCGPAVAAHVSNLREGRPVWSATAHPDGYLVCKVAAKREDDFGHLWFTIHPDLGDRAAKQVRRSFENVDCTLYVAEAHADDASERLDAALDDMKREAGG